METDVFQSLHDQNTYGAKSDAVIDISHCSIEGFDIEPEQV